jgi:hypothetical protein
MTHQILIAARPRAVLRSGALALLCLAGAAHAQEPLQSLRGIVRDTAGGPIGGANVSVGTRHTTTNREGTFRVDSLRPGQYPVTVRMIGYSPVRSRIAILAGEPTEVEYFLVPAPVLLPAVVVEGRRTGLFGSVGDTAYRAIMGARVQVAGPRGGETRTDSMGRFAFPAADAGQYVIRVTFPGYTERRLALGLQRGEGRELAFLLSPSPETTSLAADEAIQGLGSRLTTGLERERLMGDQLVRYESMPLCEVPRIVAEIGRSHEVTIAFSLNGVTIDTTATLSQLCAWRADEVELVEFGKDTCAEVTQSIAMLAGSWCSGRARAVPRTMLGTGQRIRAQSAGMKYVIVWEKR